MKTIKLKRYLSGLKGVDGKPVDINKIALMGEDFVNDRMKISIYDLPEWIKQGARISMTKEDIKVIKEHIDNL